MKNLSKTFQENIDRYRLEHDILKKRHISWSLIRLMCFLLFLAMVIYLATINQGEMIAILFIGFTIGFFYLIKHHNKIAFLRDHQLFLIRVNQQELNRLDYKLEGIENGQKYLDYCHPYSGDLDLFGKHSVYQLLNRTSTPGGSKKLAEWMLKAESKSIILERQEAAKSILNHQDWRQDFQAHGIHIKDEAENIQLLLEWLRKPLALRGHSSFKLIMVIMPLLSLISLLLWQLGYTYYFLLGMVFLNSFVLFSISKKMITITKYAEKGALALNAYLKLFVMVENAGFDASLIKNLKSNLVHGGENASVAIKKLHKILYNLENRANLFYWILNALFLLDLYWLLQATKWKSRNGNDADHWFDTVHIMEAINSLSGFSYLNPEYCYPVISDQQICLKAKQIGHPLISPKDSVCNDVDVDSSNKIAVITGSNMSGKSTFLRTVGVNTVLAQIGANVNAQSFECAPCEVFTSMRTQDNLKESVSSFYAELKRLRQLLETINDQLPQLFLLDEILKGTNSQDRNKGAVSLIKQLAPLNAFGFISTHDLALGNLAQTNNCIHNLSFNSTIDGNEINFDYKLHEGVCTSFNASKLMEKMGIRILDEEKPNEN